jgi:outer membrane cobalamin receptor
MSSQPRRCIVDSWLTKRMELWVAKKRCKRLGHKATWAEILSAGAVMGLPVLMRVSPAGAQTPPPLQEVVVTASLEEEIPQQLAQYGTHVDTVTSEEIQTGGFIDVAQALEALTPGLYIASGNGPFDYVQVSLQGSRTEDVLWLVDGVRINNRLYGSTTPLDTIPASMIDHIEVLDGGQALFYGTQAMAGAINIVTKTFTDHPDGAFSLGADSNNGKHMEGYFRDALNDNDFVVYATHDESPGIQSFPTADYQPSGTERRRPYDVTTLGAKYAYNFASDLAFSAQYQHTDATLGFAEAAVTADAFNARNEDLVSSKLDYIPSDAFKFYIKDYYHRWSSYYTEFDNGSAPYTYTPGTPGEITVANNDDFWGYKDYGVSLLSQIAVNRGLEYLVGYDFQSYIGHDAVLVIQQETERINAFIGQVRTTPELIPGAHLSAGFRYNNASFGPSALVWNTGGQYDITPSLFIRENVGTSFRLPTDEELFANDPDDERGDPNLKPETSTDANVSFGGLVPFGGPAPLKWEAIGFYRLVKNLIDYQSFDAATDQYVFGNVPGNIAVHGAELTVEAPVTAKLSGTFSATYSRARQAGENFQFDQIPLTQFKVGLDYHPTERYGADLTLVNIGDLDDEPLGVGNGRVGYGDYTVVNVNARYFLDAHRHQRIDVHVGNLFNHVYYTGLQAAETDVGQIPYVVHDLALPRTFGVNYTYSLQ